MEINKIRRTIKEGYEILNSAEWRMNLGGDNDTLRDLLEIATNYLEWKLEEKDENSQTMETR